MSEDAWRVVALVGSWPVYALFVVVLFLFSASWFFLPLALMLLLVMGACYALKWFFSRERPRPRRRPRRLRWWNHWRHVSSFSFPSAHAARAAGLFAVSSFMAQVWVSLLLFGFWVVVSYARLASRDHRSRDVIWGSVVGFVSGLAALLLSPLFAPWF